MEDSLPSSFAHYVRRVSPTSLPSGTSHEPVQATTIVAAEFDGGVVMAGDRRATIGSTIAMRDIEKVFGADQHSVIGVAGVAGLAIDLVRLFQVELEHYEKVEAAQLSLSGKANRLAALLRGQLEQAMAGLAVVPLFVGWDAELGRGRMFSYDVAGGRYEERGFAAVGSGAVFARGSLKKLYQPQASEADAINVLLQALYDAADDDAATSGLDLARGIFPLVMSVTAQGVRQLAADEVRAIATEILAEREASPDGPKVVR